MKYTITEVDVTTGEEVTRPMTTAEAAQIDDDVAKTAEIVAAIAAKNAAKKAIADRLGLTADELATLLS
jgi:hypothetical protein